MTEYDIEVSVATYEQKKLAVIECLKKGVGFNIRELRKCVSKEISVSEKTVSRILRELYGSGLVVNKNKKWYLAAVVMTKTGTGGAINAIIYK